MEAGENYDIKKDDLETKPSRSEEFNVVRDFNRSETKGSSAPDSEKTESFDTSVTSVPTVTPHLPQLTMTGEYLSNKKQGYRVAENSNK